MNAVAQEAKRMRQKAIRKLNEHESTIETVEHGLAAGTETHHVLLPKEEEDSTIFLVRKNPMQQRISF